LIGCAAIQADMERYNKIMAINAEQAQMSKEERSQSLPWTMAVMTWDKPAFSKARKRLSKVYKDMSESAFIKQMKMQTLTGRGGNPIAVYGDGWLHDLDLYIKTAQLYRNEFVFGYVENGIVRERIIVTCENNKVVDIIELPDISPKDVDWREVKAVPISHSWTKEAFFSAMDKMKELKIGMDRWQMQRIMKGNWMELQPGRLYFICDGYLHNLYKSEDTSNGLKQTLFFGYRENEQDFPKFVITLLNGKISEISQLGDRTKD
jgi:hypothetical protein